MNKVRKAVEGSGMKLEKLGCQVRVEEDLKKRKFKITQLPALYPPQGQKEYRLNFLWTKI